MVQFERWTQWAQSWSGDRDSARVLYVKPLTPPAETYGSCAFILLSHCKNHDLRPFHLQKVRVSGLACIPQFLVMIGAAFRVLLFSESRTIKVWYRNKRASSQSDWISSAFLHHTVTSCCIQKHKVTFGVSRRCAKLSLTHSWPLWGQWLTY